MENCILEPGTRSIKAEPDNLTESLPTALLKPLQQTSQILPTQGNSSRSRTVTVKFKIQKRLTPFLVFAFILPVIFIYLITSGKEANVVFQLGLLLLLEINIIFFDFALCNYFEGKKLARIWLIEALLVFLTVLLIL